LLDEHTEGASATEFMFQQGVSSALVGNYAVGSHHAVQQTPYADRDLIETLSLMPGRAPRFGKSVSVMRLRDLKHRFFGEPKRVSFQRALVHRLGGFAAHYPINYGWRASGGISLAGFARGTAALLGMIAEKGQLEEGPCGGAIERTGVRALHDFRCPAHWLRKHLRDFTSDLLTSRAVRQTGIFQPDALAKAVQEHFASRKNHYDGLTFALAVAIAQTMFCSKEGYSEWLPLTARDSDCGSPRAGHGRRAAG
jgi:hypothetical protein